MRNIFNTKTDDQKRVVTPKQAYKNGISWGEAKTQLLNLLEEFIQPYRNEYQEICKDRNFVEKTLREGAEKPIEVSTPILEEVRRRVGIKSF